MGFFVPLSWLVIAAVGVGAAMNVGRHRPNDAVAARTLRTTLAARWIGLIAGVAAGYWMWNQPFGLGQSAMLTLPACALPMLLGVMVGEYAAVGPAGSTRTAQLTPRRLRDYVPRALTAAVVATLVVGTAMLAVFTAMGSADDMGRAGRSLAFVCSARHTGSVGPWPGSFYTAPLAAFLAVAVVMVGVGLRAVVARPFREGDVDEDGQLRRDSARAIVAALGVTVSSTLAAIAMVAAISLRDVDCRSAFMTILMMLSSVLCVVFLVVAVWSAGELLASMVGRPMRRERLG